ncbi:Xaa-Pro peptidase family protein [soil metagenome]
MTMNDIDAPEIFQPDAEGNGDAPARAAAGSAVNEPQRRAALRERLAAAAIAALLVTDLRNVRYLTGFTGTAGRLLVTADGHGDVFVTDGRYATQAAEQVADLPRAITRADDWLPDALAGRDRLGLESHVVPWAVAEQLRALLTDVEVVPAAGHVEALRAVKDAGELAAIGRACAVADAAFAVLLADLRPGWTERHAARHLERAMEDRGADARAFETIVASGPNGARPHHRPTDRRLRRGELVTIDFGARLDGYHSDCTRVLSLGEPDGDARALFELALAAQQAGLDAVADGAATADVDAACRDLISAAGRGEEFTHGTGHGIGLDVHEDPRLAADAAGTLRAAMVVTVEPGVYVPGLGGARVEDTVAVTGAGSEILTATPKPLAVL